ncbi:hypothetical protein RYX36_032808, partial [Vicia faba]
MSDSSLKTIFTDADFDGHVPFFGGIDANASVSHFSRLEAPLRILVRDLPYQEADLR